MRIAVNTRFLQSGKMEGFGWYANETLGRIVRQHPEHEFIFLFDRPFDPKFVFASNVKPVVIGPQARHVFLFIPWFNRSVTRALREHKADMFVSPDGYLSLRTRVPQLAVIHDLNFEHFPRFLPFLPRWYYRRYFPKFARKAKRILTVSAYSKADIAATYRVDSDKIDVALNGASDVFTPSTPEQQQDFRQRYTSGLPYFLFVGALHPRKNPECLFRAYDAFRKQCDQPHRLLMVGEKYYWTGQAQKTHDSMQFGDEVIFTGHMDQSELVRAYGSARAFVFPSFFEGFGIPLAEAMKCGTPVLSSNATSLPEVGGDAAAYFDPNQPQQLAEQMLRLATDENIRNFMVMRSLQRGSVFSWDQTAQGMWNSIEKLARAEGLL